MHVKRDPVILKSEIDLPDMLITLPFGQRELILPAGLNVIVLNTKSWESLFVNFSGSSRRRVWNSKA